MFGSWLVLGIFSTVTGFVVEILPLLGMSPVEAASLPLIGPLYHADVWWVALVNELLGLVVLALYVFLERVTSPPRISWNTVKFSTRSNSRSGSHVAWLWTPIQTSEGSRRIWQS